MNFRPQRVGKLIREELSKIILEELEFPDALPTITDVEVDKKLEHAVVLLSVIPSVSSDRVLEELKRAAGRLQHLLNKKISIKPMPRIRFEIDHGLEHAAQVEKLLLDK
ncbi:30S ribosome-binding factor RbfA [Candidatus Parcubacteria bacterium]|nr:MAG: 30S ribosome-binding factor RbfA [Candidatus Parcubacteria bacterium]